ncbi:hypothetical protein CASFOL_000729 [Castilleja foliolosa]|uniref:ATP-dependent DNA helicase n=1 Tax=Castilleja foliolosa TaxID=1961234 RepID=A0ABD3EKJ0_9LAMI
MGGYHCINRSPPSSPLCTQYTILPVIPKGSRQDVVSATINASYIWRNCEVSKLTKNMRLQSMSSSDESVQLSRFAEWIANIGDGTIGDEVDDAYIIEIPENMLIQDNGDPIDSFAQVIYPNIEQRIEDPKYLQDRAILAPTLDVVDAVNDYMIGKLSGDCHKYYSSNTVCKSDSNGDMLGDVHTPEFLNSIKCSGVSNHELNLKVGTPVMLLRNIDPSNGLCNGTRLLIIRLGSYVLECKILTGHSAGDKVLVPRLSLTPSDVRVPFKFQRRQFPVMISYAMTINKSQGQSLANVGLYLKKPVFSHGQLYVAVSRVTNPTGLKILLCSDEDGETNSTVNVVYKEVFQNL